MRILALDTTFGACSVAVREGARLLAHRFERMERGHAEALAPMVDDVMRESEIAFSELDRLGITTGPGTFTGQRVGLAFMRGLRLALERPLIGITSLRAMGEQARALTPCAVAAAIHDARRDEVYFEIVGDRPGAPKIVPLAEAVSELCSLSSGGAIALAGTAAERAFAIGREKGLSAILAGIVAPDADWVARICASAPETSEVPRALYLRDADAKRPA